MLMTSSGPTGYPVSYQSLSIAPVPSLCHRATALSNPIVMLRPALGI
jgi:hypothetical protein